MSRFFRGDSSSESSSSDEEELYSEEEEEVKADSEEDSDQDAEDSDESSSDDSEGGKKTGANRFMKGDSESEDSSEDERGQVKSAKDKRIEELESTIKAIENGKKINDWNVISNGTLFWADGWSMVLMLVD